MIRKHKILSFSYGRAQILYCIQYLVIVNRSTNNLESTHTFISITNRSTLHRFKLPQNTSGYHSISDAIADDRGKNPVVVGVVVVGTVWMQEGRSSAEDYSSGSLETTTSEYESYAVDPCFQFGCASTDGWRKSFYRPKFADVDLFTQLNSCRSPC